MEARRHQAARVKFCGLSNAMEKGIAPIPAFYACYLLRSIVRHASLYIGSTPNPPRRLRQHNGESKGGAVRTSKDSLRPWEMTCLVTGFPSKIAALQFEWAWQNPQLTRHIAPDSRITQAAMTTRISPKTGKARKRSKRPRLSLTDRLRNLHLLLRARSFRQWPLKLTFYYEDVFRVWSKLIEQTTERLPNGLQVALDEPSRNSRNSKQSDGEHAATERSGIHGLDLDYVKLKGHLEKSRAILSADEHNLKCSICKKVLPTSGAATLVCPSDGCAAVSHLQCLATHFRKGLEEEEIVVRSSGFCPGCHSETQWTDLVKELSLRMRGEKEIKTIFKPKRAKKGSTKVADVLDDESEQSDDDKDLRNIAVKGEWPSIGDSSDDDAIAAHVHRQTSRSDPTQGQRSLKKKAQPQTPHFEAIIEDSEWDEAELLT
ncbi:Structure-specific endonuclease subunit SLX1 [Cercospora zeina]